MLNNRECLIAPVEDRELIYNFIIDWQQELDNRFSSYIITGQLCCLPN